MTVQGSADSGGCQNASKSVMGQCGRFGVQSEGQGTLHRVQIKHYGGDFLLTNTGTWFSNSTFQVTLLYAFVVVHISNILDVILFMVGTIRKKKFRECSISQY